MERLAAMTVLHKHSERINNLTESESRNRYASIGSTALQIRDTGRIELAIMLAVALLAFAGAPYYVALAGASALVFTTVYEYAALQPRLLRVGTSTVRGNMVALVASSLAFASLCFAIGWTFRWLIAI